MESETSSPRGDNLASKDDVRVYLFGKKKEKKPSRTFSSFPLFQRQKRSTQPEATMLVLNDILIDERVFVLDGKYKGGRGSVCGKTPTKARVRFDKRVRGEKEANVLPSMLNHIVVPQAASKKENPGPALNKKEIRMLWNSPELQGLGRLLARLGIHPSNNVSLEVCLERAYETSCRSLEEDLESTWGAKPPTKGTRKEGPAQQPKEE